MSLGTGITFRRIRPDWVPVPTFSGLPNTLGFQFSSDVPIMAYGMWFWLPPGVIVTDLGSRLFSAGGALLASGTLPMANLVQSVWNWVPFTVPYLCAAGTDYRPGVYQDNENTFESPSAFPIVDPTGHVTISGGWFKEPGDGFPDISWGGMHATDLGFSF